MSLFEPVSLYFYQILFSLPKEIEDVIKREKYHVITTYGSLKRADSVPHITLCEFAIPEEYSDKVIFGIKEEFERIDALFVSLTGYYTWSRNKLIAVRVEPVSAFQELFDILSSVKRTYSFFKKETQFQISKTPHITIALGGNKFEYLEAGYRDKKLDVSCLLETVIIRKSISGEAYKTIERIALR